MVGRKRLPDKIKKLKGTLQPCRIVKDGLEYNAFQMLPDPPIHFREKQKGVYFDIGNRLLFIGILNPLNIDIFIMYCFFLGTHYECEDKMNDLMKHVFGRYDESNKVIGFELHGLTKYSIECAKQARLIGAEFGLTPASSSKVNMPKLKDKSEFDQYINEQS